MSEMIKRVAAAIELAGEKVGAFYEVSDAEMIGIARAAIEAMREPTDAMVSAADSDWGPQLRDNWREMIDAALDAALGAALGKVDA